MIEHLITLLMLILLQVVLGFDNLLYISLESKRAPEDQRKRVRSLGIGIAIFLRIALLFILTKLIASFQKPLFHLGLGGDKEVTGHSGDTQTVHSLIDGSFNLHALIVLLGGGFIIYTAMKEIFHMLSLEEHHVTEDTKKKSVNMVITSIILMNLVFSFDSILSAMALTDEFWVMAIAIITGGVLMIWLSDHVSTFLAKNRMYEVLGLFILFLVGVMLISEGGAPRTSPISGPKKSYP